MRRPKPVGICFAFAMLLAGAVAAGAQAGCGGCPSADGNLGSNFNSRLGGFWGRVFDRGGKPYAGAVIKISFAAMGQTQLMIGTTQQVRSHNTTRAALDETWRVVVKKNGKYAIYGLPNGLFRVSVYSPQGRLLYRIQHTPDVSLDFPVANLNFNMRKLLSPAAEFARMTPAERRQYQRQLAKLQKQQREHAHIERLNRILIQNARLAAGGHWRMAEALMRPAVHLESRQPLLWQRLGDDEMGLQQYSPAVKAYRHALALNPRQPVVMISLANALAGAGQLRAAQRFLCRARTDDPMDAKIAFYNEGVLLFNQRRYAAAAANFGRALQLDQHYARAWFGRGMALLDEAAAMAGSGLGAPHILPGTAAAFHHYLALAPDGRHAAKVRAMLHVMAASAPEKY